ncbi:MAG: LptF/LptG family permease, partial [Caulobacterales bacterium]
MFLTSRIGRYLFRELASAYAITLGVILMAITLVDVVEQMRGLGKRVKLPILDALGLTFLKIPGLIDETLAFVVLVGTMVAFIRMNRRGELSALRAAGVSAWRFTTPAFLTAAVLGLFATVALNPGGVYLSSVYEARKADIKGQGAQSKAAAERVWLRQREKNAQTIITGMPAGDGRANLLVAVFFVF